MRLKGSNNRSYNYLHNSSDKYRVDYVHLRLFLHGGLYYAKENRVEEIL